MKIASNNLASTVSHVKFGEKRKIVRIDDRQIALKLLSMGVLPGSYIEFVRVAPLKGGLQIKVGDYHIGLRNEEADKIVLA